MNSIMKWRKLFKTSYIIARNISGSQFYITNLCYKYNNLSSKIKIPIQIYNLKNVNKLNRNNYVTSVQSIQLKENLLNENIYNDNLNSETIVSIIEDLENNVYDEPESISLKLLKCCGHVLYNEPLKTRQELVNRVWNCLKNNCNLTIDHYHALLQTYIDNDYRIDTKEFLKCMKVKPTHDTYCLLLQILPKTTDCAESQIADIIRSVSDHSKKIYDALVYAYAINGNINKAKDVIQLIKKKYIVLSATTCVHLMYAYVKNNDMKSVFNILTTYRPSRAHIMKLIKLLSLSGHGTHIPDVLTYLQPLTVKDSNVISTIVQLVHEGHYCDAYNVIIHIPVNVEGQDIKETFAFHLLEEMIKLNIDQKIILEIINNFERELSISEIWRKTALISLKAANETITVAVFNEMKKVEATIDCESIWLLSLDKNVHNRERDIYSLIKQLAIVNIEIDSKTFTDFIFPYVDTSDPVLTVRKILHCGVPLTHIVPSFVEFLLNSGRLKESTTVCSQFKKKIHCENLLNSLYFSYTKSNDINSCINFLFNNCYNGNGFAVVFLKMLLDKPKYTTNDLDDIIAFIIAMRHYKTVILLEDVNYIQKKLVNYKFSKKDNILRIISTMSATSMDNCNYEEHIHPEFMDVEQLYSHFHELKSNGKNYRGVLRKLLMVFCNKNDTRVNEIIAEFNTKKLKWTPGMKLCFFNYLVKNGKIVEASLVLDEIQYEFPQFKIDNFKILHFATLLIENNKLDKALEVIDTCTVNQKPNADVATKNLLNLLITKDTCDYTVTMIDLLVKKGYCENYKWLKYLILVHILRDDIESAIEVFTRCAEQQKKTPARQELLIKIMKSTSDSSSPNWNLLQDVYDLIVNVNGKKIANVNLAIAFCTCNKIKELQHFLKKNYIEEDLLSSQLRVLDYDMIIAVTLKMLEGVEDTTNINLESICHLALQMCNERNDYERVMELTKWIKKKDIQCELLTSNVQTSTNISN